ncbi:MAG: phosphatidylglycerophosphatase A [Kiritimatiellaceae bacterium]|nr:phosphatidylglycerophosphatase A [Kiritimatiellaceae bacterium]
MKNRWIQWLATGFGFGLGRFMPGTIGTLWGIPLAWIVMQLPSLVFQSIACMALCVIAVPLCAAAEKQLGKGKDPGCIVADEYCTLPICYLGLPFTPWVVLSGFILHRIFDITKPPPIRQLQNLKGGIGIVIDDALAALLALACNHLIFRFI